MSRRELGGHQIGAVGLGCMGLSAFYVKMDAETEQQLEPGNLALLDRALELGCNHWDTANIYGNNELLLAKSLARHSREKIFLASKFGIQALPDGTRTINGQPEYVLQCCATSLERLKTDYLDLYYAHRIDPKTPIEDTVTALASLVRNNKVKHLGLSECSAETLRRAHKVHPIAAVQVEYSPFTTDIERNGLLDAARELGVKIVAYSPLGRGLLAGKFTSAADLEESDWRKHNPRFQGDNLTKNLELATKIRDVATRKNCTPGQLALSWVLAQGDDFLPIPGTKHIKYLEENLQSTSVVLTRDELAEIRELVNQVGVAGDRYPTAMMSTLNQ